MQLTLLLCRVMSDTISYVGLLLSDVVFCSISSVRLAPFVMQCSFSRCRRSVSDDLPLRACGGCGDVWYCSRQCQKRDWRLHKWSCDFKLPQRYNVSVARLSGDAVIIPECHTYIKIADLKVKIESILGIPWFQQQLLLDTKVLRDEQILRSAGVTEASCVTLLVEDGPPPLFGSSSGEEDVPPPLGSSSSGEEASELSRWQRRWRRRRRRRWQR